MLQLSILFDIAIISYCCSEIKRASPKKISCDFVKIIQISTCFVAFSNHICKFQTILRQSARENMQKNMPASSHGDAGTHALFCFENYCYILTNFMLFSHLDFPTFPTYPPIPHHRTAFPDGKAGLSECGQWCWS